MQQRMLNYPLPYLFVYLLFNVVQALVVAASTLFAIQLVQILVVAPST